MRAKPSIVSLLGLLLGFVLSAPAHADFDDDYENKQWRELEVQLPPAPDEKTLIPLYVSAATDNRFFIDGASLSVGSDGVIRYVLLILSPQGGRNVTFEGMRCSSRERRIYASGRSDGSWSKSRNNEWVRIQEVYANRHHANLYLEYFCPIGNMVHSAEEAREALRRGGHQDVRRGL